MKHLFIAIALMLSACGIDDSESAGSKGSIEFMAWESKNSPFSGYVFEFYETTFLSYIYRIDGKLGQMEILRGDYALDGDSIVLTPTEANCGEMQTSYEFIWDGSDKITIAREGMMRSFEKSEPKSPPNFLKGCFGESGIFTYL